MQLILTHADLELALIESLRSKGMTAFEPGKASVEFTFKRGTKELQCVLDTEPKAQVEVAAKPTPTAIDAPADLPKTEDPAPEQTASVPVEAEAPELAPATEAAPASAEADNLFD